jgi:stage V sporulation protein B
VSAKDNPSNASTGTPDHNATTVAKQSVRSSFLLTVSNFIEAVVLAVASLIIARLLGPSNFGVFSLALTVPIFLSLFVDFGAVYSIQRDAAYYVSRGDIAIARRKTKNAILFILFLGLVFSAACFFGASFFASLLHRSDLAPYIEISSALVISQGIFTAVTLGLLGWGATGYTSAINISQAVVKLILAPLLIILGFGVLGAVTGHVLSYVFAAVFSLVAIYFLKLREGAKIPRVPVLFDSNTVQGSNSLAKPISGAGISKSRSSQDFKIKRSFVSSLSSFTVDSKEMMRCGMSAFVANSLSQFASITFVLIVLSAFVPNLIIGYYQAAYNIAQGILLVSTAIGYSIFTAFSSLEGLKADVHSAYTYYVKYISLVLIPVVLFSIGASNALIATLYGDNYVPAGVLLSLLALSYLPSALGQTVFASFFNGIGKTKFTLLLRFTSSIIVFILAPAFELVGLGVGGVIYSLIVANLGSTLIGVYLARHYTNSHIDLQAGARIFFVSDISFLAIYVLQTVTHLTHGQTLIIDFVVFFGLYLTLLPMLRAIDLKDFERLKSSTDSLGYMSKPFNLILSYEIYLTKKIFDSR